MTHTPPFKPGDRVTLASGGAPMTVAGCYPDCATWLVDVVWLSGPLQDIPQAATYPASALRAELAKPHNDTNASMTSQ